MTLKLNGTNSEAAPAYAGDDADTGLQCGTNELKLVTGGTARATVDSSGRVLVGTSSAPIVASLTPQVFIEGTSANTSALGIKANTNDTLGSFLALAKSRGTADGDNTIVQSGDSLGEIRFAGADGTDTVSEGARIAAVVDGTPGANDLPTSLVFYTAADGASFPNERMRILPSGTLKLVSSGGIDFSGIQTNASGMTSETLDSYEEGTFTPTYATGVTSPGYTLTAGSYTKIGNCVTFTIRMRATSGTGNSSQVAIGGLPFTSSSSLKEGGAFFNYRHDLNSSSAGPFLHISANGTDIVFFNNIGGSWIGTNGSGLINRTLHIQGHYYI